MKKILVVAVYLVTALFAAQNANGQLNTINGIGFDGGNGAGVQVEIPYSGKSSRNSSSGNSNSNLEKNMGTLTAPLRLGKGLVGAVGASTNYDNTTDIYTREQRKSIINGANNAISSGVKVSTPKILLKNEKDNANSIRKKSKKSKKKVSATVTQKNILKTTPSFWLTDEYPKTNITYILPTLDNQNNQQQVDQQNELNTIDSGNENIAEQEDIVTENNGYNNTPSNNQNDMYQSVTGNSQISDQGKDITSYTALNGNLKYNVAEDISNNPNAMNVINKMHNGETFYHIKGKNGEIEYRPRLDGINENSVNEEGELFIIEVKPPNGEAYIYEGYFKDAKEAEKKCNELRTKENSKLAKDAMSSGIKTPNINIGFQNGVDPLTQFTSQFDLSQNKSTSTYKSVEYEIKTVTPIKKTVTPSPVQNNLPQTSAPAQVEPQQPEEKVMIGIGGDPGNGEMD